MADRFIRACRRQPVDVTPVWLMRQAGRYLPEYQALREKYGILDIINTPELAAQITLQPIRRFELDAAIIFSDLLPPLVGMGLDLSFERGEGPIIHNPIRSQSDIARLRTPPAEETLSPTLTAIRLARRELEAHGTPLIGFAGAPFTLASYAIEGGATRNYVLTKTLMYREPAAWRELMTKLVAVVSDYLVCQAKAGAQALQLFDSWAGALSPDDYQRYALPYNRAIISAARSTGVPVISFSTGAGAMLELVAEAGGDVISIDWRIGLADAWRRIGNDFAIQGNLDPVALFAPKEELLRMADEVLRQAGGRPGHIFNLGHGILPGTPVDNVAALVDYVHTAGASANMDASRLQR